MNFELWMTVVYVVHNSKFIIGRRNYYALFIISRMISVMSG